jgi:hypothetical protein
MPFSNIPTYMYDISVGADSEDMYGEMLDVRASNNKLSLTINNPVT